MTKKEKRRKKI